MILSLLIEKNNKYAYIVGGNFLGHTSSQKLQVTKKLRLGEIVFPRKETPNSLTNIKRSAINSASFLIKSKFTCLQMLLLTVGWALPSHPSVKAISFRHVHRPKKAILSLRFPLPR